MPLTNESTHNILSEKMDRIDNPIYIKFAAIDIGSNAIRLLFYNIYEDGNGQDVFKKVALTRVPIRLGEDVFVNGSISKEKEDKLLKAMLAFRNLIEIHDVKGYRACATSAMREADNANEIIKKIKMQTGIDVLIIDGNTEADLIFSNHIAENMSHARAYLYIDVGGGSTEISLFFNGKKRSSDSFNIGTVRMLHDKVTDEDWQQLKQQCQMLRELYPNIMAIGSGGNIIKLQKLTGVAEGSSFSRSQLKDVYQKLKASSLSTRIWKYNLNPDRADVIVPAAEIYLQICKYADIKSIIVPQVGLSDGIIHKLYEDFRKESTIK